MTNAQSPPSAADHAPPAPSPDGSSGAPTADSADGPARGDLIALVGTTTRLYADCLLPNGALVEAPAHLPFYPAKARDTLRCRPGLDAAVAILAMDALGRDVRTPLLRWVRDRAAGFADDGLLHRAYHVHGPVADDRRDLLGTALLLYAINRPRPPRAASPAPNPRPPASNEIAREVGRGLASALAVRWDGRERRFRDYDNSDGAGPFAAAGLAATEAGLRAAGAALEIGEWTRLADALVGERDAAVAALLAADPIADDANGREGAIVAGLALGWPFGATDRATAGALVLRAERTMVAGDDPTRTAPHADPGPLRTDDALRPGDLFWLAAALAAADRATEAGRYFDAALATADVDGHFPAHADPVDLDPAPRPYLLAHLLFLVAADALGHLAAVPKSGYAGSQRP